MSASRTTEVHRIVSGDRQLELFVAGGIQSDGEPIVELNFVLRESESAQGRISVEMSPLQASVLAAVIGPLRELAAVVEALAGDDVSDGRRVLADKIWPTEQDTFMCARIAMEHGVRELIVETGYLIAPHWFIPVRTLFLWPEARGGELADALGLVVRQLMPFSDTIRTLDAIVELAGERRATNGGAPDAADTRPLTDVPEKD